MILDLELTDDSIPEVNAGECTKTERKPNITNICAGDLIFSDDFTDNSLNNHFWTVEQRYADAPVSMINK